MPSASGEHRLGYVRAKRRGFSLIVVLIIAIIGLAIVGTMVQVAVTSGGSGRMSSAGNTKYNFMQDAVEEGKAALRGAMDHNGAAPRFVGYDPSTPPTITQLSDLLIDHDFPSGLGKGVVLNRAISKATLGRLGIAGNGGTMSVMIYDMQYKADSIKYPPMTDQDFQRLPPSIILSGSSDWNRGGADDPDNPPPAGISGSPTGDGVYLIRATLLINGHGKPTILDTALIQSNSE